MPICVGNFRYTRLLVGVASSKNAANGVIAALTGTTDGFNISDGLHQRRDANDQRSLH